MLKLIYANNWHIIPCLIYLNLSNYITTKHTRSTLVQLSGFINAKSYLVTVVQRLFLVIYLFVLLVFLHSAVTWDITPVWHAPSGPTCLRSTTWRHHATRDWISSRMQWTTWTPAVTNTRSWICITRCSVLRCALSTCHTWGMRWGHLNASAF